MDLSYLGVVRDYSCKIPKCENRGSTPLKVTFFSLGSVRICNVCTKYGRAVLYIEEPSLRLGWEQL